MILIADSGSTKTAWCLISGNQRVKDITTKGINPFYQTEEEIEAELKNTLCQEIGGENKINSVYFYGAGCADSQINNKLAKTLQQVLKSDKAEVSSDMLGAARGIFKHQKGIACIMGTGSNSCYYDGEKIVDNVSPLGYILGDEGSGAYFGNAVDNVFVYNSNVKTYIQNFSMYGRVYFENCDVCEYVALPRASYVNCNVYKSS